MIRYFTTRPGRPGDRTYRVESDFIDPTAIRLAGDDIYPPMGLRPDDVIAGVEVALPDQAVLDKATVPYEELWDRPFDLHGRLGNRIAVVVDVEEDKPAPGTNVAAGFLHSSAMQVMLERSSPRWSDGGGLVLLVLGAVSGTLAGLLVGRRDRSRNRSTRWWYVLRVAGLLIGAILLLGATVLVVTWLTYWSASVLVYPIPAIFAATLGVAIAAIVFLMRPTSAARHAVAGVDSDRPTPSTLQET